MSLLCQTCYTLVTVYQNMQQSVPRSAEARARRSAEQAMRGQAAARSPRSRNEPMQRFGSQYRVRPVNLVLLPPARSESSPSPFFGESFVGGYACAYAGIAGMETVRRRNPMHTCVRVLTTGHHRRRSSSSRCFGRHGQCVGRATSKANSVCFEIT